MRRPYAVIKFLLGVIFNSLLIVGHAPDGRLTIEGEIKKCHALLGTLEGAR